MFLVALNPVKAALADAPEAWEWASPRAMIAGQDTQYVTVAPALSRIGDFAGYLKAAAKSDSRWIDILKAEFIRRPVGAKAWIEQLEAETGQKLSPQKRGPKPTTEAAADEDTASLF